jgi:hypothetical protein
MASDDDNTLLRAMARRIQATIGATGRCLITSPVELAQLNTLGLDELRGFAARHGWTAVPRLGFTQIEFFAVHLPRVRSGLV